MSDETPVVTIAAGATVVYHGADGPEAGSVTNVDPDRELIECREVPGVLRVEDLLAVGIYGDEARWELDGNGAVADRIRLEDDE